ncbi:sodium channel and clathrin linker 1 isoform X5 [Sus scrofa]|uniref:sodium channel and clathrin linker 1 isoform X5 n=1 Tax=Sus scrofa TaxID=9823 RepID=UPI000A2B73E9|nr:sodium channel and clathrin linker 1 isoform X5 [Sus scrofa]
MATEIKFLRDQNHEVLRQNQMENDSKCSSIQKDVLKGNGDNTLENSVVDKSFLVPLITEYDKHLEEINGQLQYYQKQMGEMKLQLENVIKENERLHSELKDAVEKQLEALPFATEVGNEIYTDDETVRNLQEQLQLANQEKTQAVELWQTVSQELDRLQKLYQEHMTEAQIHVVESQKQKDQLTNFQHLTKQLHVTNENMEMTNQHFLRAVTEQNVEIEQLRKQLRKAKLDLRMAVAKVEELSKMTKDLQEQMQKKEEDMESAQGREEASDRRLQQLQSSIKQLEMRLHLSTQEATQLREEKAHLEKQSRELQVKCNELQNEKYEAIIRARDSIQLLEEANLQRNQALLEEKQKEEDIEKMKESFSRIVQESAIRTRKEVENTRKQYNIQISRLAAELSALQTECAEKQGQIERAIREKRAVEEELEKVKKKRKKIPKPNCKYSTLLSAFIILSTSNPYIISILLIYHEGRINESDYRKLEEMHQRCLVADRSKDDLQLRLRTAENKLKQLEINSSEELSRCQEMIQKLQKVLESERENCGFVSEERLRLQQENEQLQKQVEELRKIALEAQKQAKLKVIINY